jgi:predicted ATPase
MQTGMLVRRGMGKEVCAAEIHATMFTALGYEVASIRCESTDDRPVVELF